jgi:hypothetical protein
MLANSSAKQARTLVVSQSAMSRHRMAAHAARKDGE